MRIGGGIIGKDTARSSWHFYISEYRAWPFGVKLYDLNGGNDYRSEVRRMHLFPVSQLQIGGGFLRFFGGPRYKVSLIIMASSFWPFFCHFLPCMALWQGRKYEYENCQVPVWPGRHGHTSIN